MNNSDVNHENNPDLLSDADFIALMETEFQATKTPTNELQKQRVWTAIQEKVQIKKRKNSHNWLSLAAVVLVAVTLFPVLKVSISPQDTFRIKGSSSLPAIHLSAYKLQKNGELNPVSHSINSGDTVVFKVGATQQVVMGLAVAINKSKPQMRFVSDLTPAGMEQLLQRDERSYGYRVEASDRELKFCAIGANTLDELQSASTAMVNTWQTLYREACVTLFVNP